MLASRTLLFPGPQQPLSHLGVTLLRHVVGAGVRYSLYQLGLPMPESPPVRIARLRLYLDAKGLEMETSGEPQGTFLAQAMLDPGGVAEARVSGRVAGAFRFHGVRLQYWIRRVRRFSVPDGSWAACRSVLDAWLPRLNDVFLCECIAALSRRQARAKGKVAGEVQSRQATRFLIRMNPTPGSLGPPDPLLPAWPQEMKGNDNASQRPLVHPLRGRFREEYRLFLEALRPAYLALAEGAVESGLIDQADDAFFIPFDLASDLEAEGPLSWLRPAVAANRREYETELGRPSPPDVLMQASDAEVSGESGAAEDWSLAPLAPLP